MPIPPIKPVYFLLGFTFIFFCIQLYFYVRYYFEIAKKSRRETKNPLPTPTALPPVSVIICAKEEGENIRKFLPSVLKQDYPDFEVIVVNDGNNAEMQSELAQLKTRYENLHETFVPADADVISRKKLALTIGIKAAKNEILLFTDADCQAQSHHWITSMVRNFDAETEVVLGYGCYFAEKNFLSRLISFDTLFIAMQYMGFAAKGRPYMGVGRNLAYRRSTFFNHRGFAGMLHLQSGDDDLFVSAVANKHNTKTEISVESKTLSVPKSSFRQWILQRERHLSTSVNYKKDTLQRIGTEVVSRGLFYACLVATLCTGELIGLTALSLFIVRYAVQATAINLSAKALSERRFYTLILIFDILIPLINLFLLMRSKIFYKKNHIYNWK